MNRNSTPKAFFSQRRKGAKKENTSLKKRMNNEGLDLSLRHIKSHSHAAVVTVLCVLGGFASDRSSQLLFNFNTNEPDILIW